MGFNSGFKGLIERSLVLGYTHIALFENKIIELYYILQI